VCPLNLCIGVWLATAPALADPLRVAVASSFADTMQVLAERFEASSGQHVVLVAGSTGKLAAQIENGAPFEVLVAADSETPARLEAAGLAVEGTRVTYALGKLVLFSAQRGYVDERGAVLSSGTYRHLAIANPRLAPYGAAALQVLGTLGLLDSVRSRLVAGESVAQAYQFVASGSAELGFVALSLLVSEAGSCPASCWLVPPALYAPLRQDAVVIAAGRKPEAAALVAYLTSASARAWIATRGFDVPETTAPRP
jgi:molybdate transport system substrate-binding protein